MKEALVLFRKDREAIIEELRQSDDLLALKVLTELLRATKGEEEADGPNR